MAYSVTNAPFLQVASFDGAVPSWWGYTSADSHATVDGAGYFTNAGVLGMRVGDLVIAAETATNTSKIHRVIVIAAFGDVNHAGNGAANLAS